MKTYIFETMVIYAKGMSKREITANERRYGKLIRIA
jgi:hypothetical protein